MADPSNAVYPALRALFIQNQLHSNNALIVVVGGDRSNHPYPLKTHRTWEDSVGLLWALCLLRNISDVVRFHTKADAVCGSVVSSCGVTIAVTSPHDRCGFADEPLPGEQLGARPFLDEAGVSNPREEPFLVVAGIMLDPDRRYGTLDARLRTLAEECFPPERSRCLPKSGRWVTVRPFPRKDVFMALGSSLADARWFRDGYKREVEGNDMMSRAILAMMIALATSMNAGRSSGEVCGVPTGIDGDTLRVGSITKFRLRWH